MPHCNPAPPHPEPGQVYNAICIEPWMPLALILMLLGLLLYAGVIRGYFPAGVR